MLMSDPISGKKASRAIGLMQLDLPTLEFQEKAHLETMGGPFPERNHDFHDFTRVLDLACGAGSWVLEVARSNPHLEVLGITVLPALLERARERARAQGLNNACFTLAPGDERPRLNFADNEFDFINTQALFAWLQADEWIEVLRDLWRITRPGGYLRMTEPERGQSTSLAYERVLDLYLQSLQTNGQRLSPDDRHIGAANQLLALCQATGWGELTRKAYLVEENGSVYEAKEARKSLEHTRQMVGPNILQAGIIGPEELADLFSQAEKQMMRPDFAIHRYLVTVSGRKQVPGS